MQIQSLAVCCPALQSSEAVWLRGASARQARHRVGPQDEGMVRRGCSPFILLQPYRQNLLFVWGLFTFHLILQLLPAV